MKNRYFLKSTMSDTTKRLASSEMNAVAALSPATIVYSVEVKYSSLPLRPWSYSHVLAVDDQEHMIIGISA